MEAASAPAGPPGPSSGPLPCARTRAAAAVAGEPGEEREVGQRVVYAAAHPVVSLCGDFVEPGDGILPPALGVPLLGGVQFCKPLGHQILITLGCALRRDTALFVGRVSSTNWMFAGNDAHNTGQGQCTSANNTDPISQEEGVMHLLNND